MIKAQLRWGLALPMLLVAAGCGSIPDVVVDTAKQSAKETIEQRIDELLAEFAGQIDLSTLIPGASERE